MSTTAIPTWCSVCGKPISSTAYLPGGLRMHPECASVRHPMTTSEALEPSAAAQVEFAELWRDMDKSHKVPPQFLDRLSDLIDAHLSDALPPTPKAEAADPSFPDAMDDSEVRIWINACNHEPARQALRQLLAYRVRGVSQPLRSAPAATVEDGFAAEDFALVAGILRADRVSEAVRKAALSNNINVIIAALDRAALTDAGPAAAEGWVVVPREPVPEMLAAWYRYKNGHHFPDEPAPCDTSDYGAYRAMVAASPKPVQGAGK